MTEASSNQANIDTIPPAVMQLALDYMYKGEVVKQTHSDIQSAAQQMFTCLFTY